MICDTSHTQIIAVHGRAFVNRQLHATNRTPSYGISRTSRNHLLRPRTKRPRHDSRVCLKPLHPIPGVISLCDQRGVFRPQFLYAQRVAHILDNTMAFPCALLKFIQPVAHTVEQRLRNNDLKPILQIVQELLPLCCPQRRLSHHHSFCLRHRRKRMLPPCSVRPFRIPERSRPCRREIPHELVNWLSRCIRDVFQRQAVLSVHLEHLLTMSLPLPKILNGVFRRICGQNEGLVAPCQTHSARVARRRQGASLRCAAAARG